MINLKCLKTDLANCVISFDRRIFVTDLIDEYDLSFPEVNDILVDYLEKDENKNHVKYNKRYVVAGEEVLPKQSNNDDDDHTEEVIKKIYTIVPEDKLQQRLKSLRDGHSFLYSVEISGGAKQPAYVFKPIKMAKDVELRHPRPNTIPEIKPIEEQPSSSSKVATQTTDNSLTKTVKKAEIDEAPKMAKNVVNKKENSKSTSLFSSKEPSKRGGIDKMFKAMSPTKKVDLKNKPEAGKGKQQKLNYSSEEADKGSKDNSPKAGKITTKEKPSSVKKSKGESLNLPSSSSTAKGKDEDKLLNQSVSVFGSEEECNTSSDDEEKMEAIRREIRMADANFESADTEESGAVKRSRRILDSDSEGEGDTHKVEEPPKKQEKLTEQEPTTFMDDDGFLVTVKPKRSMTFNSYKSTEPVKVEKAVEEIKKEPPPPILTTKKKQAGIMNYFSKK